VIPPSSLLHIRCQGMLKVILYTDARLLQPLSCAFEPDPPEPLILIISLSRDFLLQEYVVEGRKE
jgi:hypothetical protein